MILVKQNKLTGKRQGARVYSHTREQAKLARTHLWFAKHLRAFCNLMKYAFTRLAVLLYRNNEGQKISSNLS